MHQEGSGNIQAGRDVIIRVEKLGDGLVSIGSKPSKIAKVISLLATEVNTDIPDEYSAVSFYGINEKIAYNNVVRYKPIIDRYGYYGGTVEGVCEKLDTDKPNSKSRVFEFIKYQYMYEKAKICGDASDEQCLKLVQENADDIIDSVLECLFSLIKDSKDLDGVDVEDIQLCLVALLSVAFINCQILEKPPLADSI